MAKLTDDELISICRKEESVAQSWQDARLMTFRQRSYSYYDRDPNEFGIEEGQSQVVTSEVADTVESVMPGMMRVFASGEEIAEFQPIEEADEQAAKEATQYVPHVMMRENPGYRIIYWFCKDTLMYRLAVLMVDVEEVEKTKREPIVRWTEEQMAFRQQTEIEQGATEVVFEVEQDQPSTKAAAGVMPLAPLGGVGPDAESGAVGAFAQTPTEPPSLLDQSYAPTYSGTITITRKKKRVVVDNVAPEDLLISPAEVRDIDQASYAGYRKEVTASDLRVLGLSQDEIDSLSSDRRQTPEEDQRQDGQSLNLSRKDDQRRLWLVVAYVRADADGDGISEMLRVVYAHAGGDTPSGVLIEKTEWEDGEVPIVIGSAILMSHTIVGRSLVDQTMDLQDVGTAVTRAMLDNTYQVVRPRPIINNKVPILSVLDHTAGMPVQVDTSDNPMNHVGYVQVPPIMDKALAVLGYLENKRDQRTGTSRLGNNMDDDALADASDMTKGGTQILRSAAQERQGLMASTLANTGFDRLYRLIYRAIKRCEGGPTKYYAKNEWQSCDPSKWPDDMHLVVSVGEGTGDKMQEKANLAGIGAAQEKLWLAQGGSGPALSLEHLANTGRRLAEASGFKATTQFFASDKDVKVGLQQLAAQPPKPDPEMAKVMQKADADKAKQASDNAMAQQRLQAEIVLKQQAAAADLQAMREKSALELQGMREKATLEAQLKREAMMADFALKREEIALEAQLEKYRIDSLPQPGSTELKQQEVRQG